MIKCVILSQVHQEAIQRQQRAAEQARLAEFEKQRREAERQARLEKEDRLRREAENNCR